MDRALRLAAFWNWLPAFRAVAEHGSVQRAALALHVSPSSLSRTVRLLEDAVGHSLFVRTGAGVTLTDAGERVLKGTREAMRNVDDALSSLRARGTATVWTAAACGTVLQRLLTAAMDAVVRAHDGAADVRIRIAATVEDRIVEQLLRGDIDVAVCESARCPEASPELVVEELGILRYAVFASRGHEIAAEQPRLVTVLGIVPEGDARTPTEVATLDGVERFAEAGAFHALLPIALAPPAFVQVSSSPVTQSVVALTRRPLADGESGWTNALTRELARSLAGP